METAASFEARFAPCSYPATRTYGGEGGEDRRLSPYPDSASGLQKLPTLPRILSSPHITAPSSASPSTALGIESFRLSAACCPPIKLMGLQRCTYF